MPDVKNTINGLQQAIDIMRRIMPNQYWFDIETPCNDAIALLKAQEPRVMSVQEVKQLKHVCQVFGRIGFRGYSATDLVDEGEGCITLSPSNMRDGKMLYNKCTYLSWEKYEESPEIKIFNGNILFVKTGSTYGKSSLVQNLPMEATINPQLLVFKRFTCFNEFLADVLQTNLIKTQVELSVIGGTIPTISQQKILNYVFPLPPINEQKLIVFSIENTCAPINEAIKVSEDRITLLQERKQIIINDVVTGKVKVV